MEIKKLSDEISVAGQLSEHDVTQVHAMGFKSIICNRPDGEDASQELFEAIRSTATRIGIEAAYIPVPTTGPTAASVEAFAEAFAKMPKPVLAYCRSGGRSAALYKAISEDTA